MMGGDMPMQEGYLDSFEALCVEPLAVEEATDVGSVTSFDGH